MSRNSGRFETTTKIKISTPYGNILKVTHYDVDEEPHNEYKMRPKCSICGGNVNCVCYNDNNSDEPLQSAIDAFQKEWCCEKIHCICEFMKSTYTDMYEELKAKYGDDEWSIVESLRGEVIDSDDDGIFCEV